MKISVIIPTLNEARHLPTTLAAIKNLNGDFEIIVADGGSTDETVHLARDANYSVICAPQGRASQMNLGAELASGEILLFLHADTILPEDTYRSVTKLLDDPKISGGCFRLKFDNPHPLLKISSFAKRFHFPAIHYGDSTYFVRKEVFHALSGFRTMPIMEDIDFWLRLNKHYKTAILTTAVLTSARRFLRYGLVKESAMDVLLVLLYNFGFSIDWIHKLYLRNKTSKNYAVSASSIGKTPLPVFGAKQNVSWYKIKYPVVTIWNWLYSNVHLALQTYHVLDFMFIHKIRPNQLDDNHAWLNGLIPETKEFIWEKNIVFASRRKQNWLAEPEEDAVIVTRVGKFLAAMVKRSNTNNGEIEQGKKRRMPHAVNLIHGSVHYNGGFLLFNDMKDAILHFSDSNFIKEFKRFMCTEKRELTILLRERAYNPEEYAWFVSFIRSHIPWYANGNGPTKKRVLYGTPSPYAAVNPINGAWAVDLMNLYRGNADKLVLPPIEKGKYFKGSYKGCQDDFTFMERFHAWAQDLTIRVKGFQGNLVFTKRRKIEPDNWAIYQTTNGQWSATYYVSHPFASIGKIRARRAAENYADE